MLNFNNKILYGLIINQMYIFVSTYKLIFWLLSSDTLKELLFVCPSCWCRASLLWMLSSLFFYFHLCTLKNEEKNCFHWKLACSKEEWYIPQHIYLQKRSLILEKIKLMKVWRKIMTMLLSLSLWESEEKGKPIRDLKG